MYVLNPARKDIWGGPAAELGRIHVIIHSGLDRTVAAWIKWICGAAAFFVFFCFLWSKAMMGLTIAYFVMDVCFDK